GAALVSIHEMSVGDLTTYILYSMFVAGSMGTFPELYANIQRSLGASERILEILDEPQEKIKVEPTCKDIGNKMSGSLSFNHVAFAYPSRPDVQILKDI